MGVLRQMYKGGYRYLEGYEKPGFTVVQTRPGGTSCAVRARSNPTTNKEASFHKSPMANNLDASYVPTKIRHEAAIGLECGDIKVSASYNRNKHEAPIVSEYGVQAELVRSAKRICFGVDETVRDCRPRCDQDPMNNQGSPATSIPSPIAAVLSKMRMNEQDANIQTEGCAELWNLAYNNENNQVTIAEAKGITMILSAMKTHSSNATVQENGCGALQNLAVNENNRVTKTGLQGSSVSGGRNIDTELQKVRHKQQRLLLLRHASKCQYEAGKCPVTPHCASMKTLWEHIAHCKDQQCTVDYCMSSRYVLSHYRRCKDARCPACGPVRETIRKSQEKESSRDGQNGGTSFQSSGVDPFAAMSDMTDDPTILLSSSGASPDLQPELKKAKIEISPSISNQFDAPPAPSNITSSAPLSTSSIGMSSYDQQIAAAGGITTILSAMKTHSSNATVQEKGCGALWNLALNNDNNRVMIADAGGIDAIQSAMENHSLNAMVQQYGCGALKNLTRLER